MPDCQHHRAEFSGSKDSSCMCKLESMMPWDRDRDQGWPFGNILWSQLPYSDHLYLCRPEPGGTVAKDERQTYFSSPLIPFHGRVSSLLDCPGCLPHLPNLSVNLPAGITLSLLPGTEAPVPTQVKTEHFH